MLGSETGLGHRRAALHALSVLLGLSGVLQLVQPLGKSTDVGTELFPPGMWLRLRKGRQSRSLRGHLCSYITDFLLN